MKTTFNVKGAGGHQTIEIDVPDDATIGDVKHLVEQYLRSHPIDEPDPSPRMIPGTTLPILAGSHNDDMPHYYQYNGACGLTSLLMALNPVRWQFAPFLDDLVDHKRAIHATDNRGKNWQQAIEFLLTQIPQKAGLKRILRETFGSDFTDGMLPLLKHDLKTSQRGSTKQSHEWLMQRVNVWKKDDELAMIASLFGCQLIPLRHSSTSHIGAVVFQPTDSDEVHHIKEEFLREHVNDREAPAICCNGNHWLAIKDLDAKHTIHYHDPACQIERTRHLQEFAGQHFYTFDCSPERWQQNEVILRNAFFATKQPKK